MRRLCLLAVLAAATPVWAATPAPNLIDARSVAMGGALRTLAGPVTAARLNPAALGRVRGFFAGTSYAAMQNKAFDAFAVTLVDNVTSLIGGAIQYLYLRGNEDREDLSLGLSAGKQGLWWGFTARFVHGRDEGQGTWDNVMTGDVGFLFERPTGTQFAVVGYNLIGTSLDFLERRAALGISQSDVFGWNFAADVVRNFERNISRGLDLHLGAEYPFKGTPWAVRFGQMWRGDSGEDFASVGFGWTGSRFGAAYGLQKTRQHSEFLHVLSAEGSF